VCGKKHKYFGEIIYDNCLLWGERAKKKERRKNNTTLVVELYAKSTVKKK